MSEQWKPGKEAGVVVSDTKSRTYDDTKDVEYYGGHLVAESIPKREYVNLIAAAPDLLEELKNIANAKRANFEDAEEFRGWAQSRARYAIAKVEGEPK